MPNVAGLSNQNLSVLQADLRASAQPRAEELLGPRVLDLVPKEIRQGIEEAGLPEDQKIVMLLQAAAQTALERMMPPELKAKIDATSDPAEKQKLTNDFIRSLDPQTFDDLNRSGVDEGQKSLMLTQMIVGAYLNKQDASIKAISQALDGISWGSDDKLLKAYSPMSSGQPVASTGNLFPLSSEDEDLLNSQSGPLRA